jgi:histidyl-tRNA synthetase
MAEGTIEPRVLKGFRDYLPAQEKKRRDFIRKVEDSFASRGFVPIDTPAMEYAEVLLGKGGGETEKQVYRFRDHGDRDVALRFDLTVPFARFMAEHLGELYLPFKRYHIAKVWRGENTQRGRFREFYQCDCDIVGPDSAGSDFEILASMASALNALGIRDFTLNVSHRGVFNLLLERLGLAGKSVEILRAVDKLSKIGKEETRTLISAIAGEAAAENILAFISPGGDFGEVLSRMESLTGGESPGSERLKRIKEMADQSGLGGSIVLNPAITRGLDYYTGIVFETFLGALPGIGSVCSGGRYNDLASLYTKERLPGVGASIGMDRLLAALEELIPGGYGARESGVIIPCMEESLLGAAFALAERLRGRGVSAEVFTEKKKLPQQFAYAEKKGIPFAVIMGPDEAARGVYGLKDLGSRESRDGLGFEELVQILAKDGA